MKPGTALRLSDGLLCLVVVVSTSTLVACPFGMIPNIPTRVLRSDRDEPPPETAEECFALADRLGVEGGPQGDLEEALSALERAEKLGADGVDLWVKQLKIIYYIAAPIQKMRSRVSPWIAKGQTLSKRVEEAAPDRVEGHYYMAVFLGFEAQNNRLRALDLLPRIVDEGQRAIDIDETYDDAGGLMLMGSVLIAAPAWPQGVGDPEQGVELLKRGVKVSDYPVNRIILAKGLLEVDQVGEACEQLDKALLTPKAGRWARTWNMYRPEAYALWNSYRCYR